MKRTAIVIFALLSLGTPVAGSASSAASLYNRGNELYKAGSFKEAADAYRQAVAAGVHNPELFYNLGNAELRSDRLGPAIAAYLRARRLAPRDPDIKFNLDYARGKISAKLPEVPPDPLTRILDFFVGRVSANEAMITLAACYWAAAFAGLGLILARGERLRRLCRRALTVTLALGVLFLPIAGVRMRRDLLTDSAVMMVKDTARSGPDETNSALFELSEGVEVTVGECESGWCRVSARGGFNGWMPAKSFERL